MPELKNYEFIEHTADVGIRIRGRDLKELFQGAASAMFDIISEEKLETQKIKTLKIKQKADNREELFINWLNELLSLSAAKELIFSDFQINKLKDTQLEAEVRGSSVKNYKINTEIKAATYHQLKIGQSGSGWQAEVIFDV